MKPFLFILILGFGELAAQTQDAPFVFKSPFGSDGTNNPGISAEDRNRMILDHVWDFYVWSFKSISTPLSKAQPGGYSQEKIDHSHTILRYGRLLETMVEFRAFITQNKGYANDIQMAELARIDPVLRSLNLHYRPNGGQGMVDFCEKMGPDKIRQSLAPVLLNADGTPRPAPPM